MLVFPSMYFTLFCYSFISNVLQNRLQNPEFVKQAFAENQKKRYCTNESCGDKKTWKRIHRGQPLKQTMNFITQNLV